MDSNKKSLFVFTHSEVVVELPKDSTTLIPAIQLKQGKALISVKFEKPVPKERSEISSLLFEHDDP